MKITRYTVFILHYTVIVVYIAYNYIIIVVHIAYRIAGIFRGYINFCGMTVRKVFAYL